MDVSLGFRTDLALLALGGSEIEDRGRHGVVRTPANPTYWCRALGFAEAETQVQLTRPPGVRGG